MATRTQSKRKCLLAVVCHKSTALLICLHISVVKMATLRQFQESFYAMDVKARKSELDTLLHDLLRNLEREITRRIFD